MWTLHLKVFMLLDALVHMNRKGILTTSAAESLGSCKMTGRLLRKPISPFAMAGVTSNEIFLISPNLGLTGGIGGNMLTNTTASNYKAQTKIRRIVLKFRSEFTSNKNFRTCLSGPTLSLLHLLKHPPESGLFLSLGMITIWDSSWVLYLITLPYLFNNVWASPSNPKSL